MKIAIPLVMIGLVSIDEARGDGFPPPPSTTQIAEILQVDTKKVSAAFLAPNRAHLGIQLVWQIDYTISGEEPAKLRLFLYRGGRDRPDPIAPGDKETPLANGDVIEYLPYSYVPAYPRQKLEFFSILISREKDWDLGIALSAAKDSDQSKLPIDLPTGGQRLLPLLDSILRKEQAKQVEVQFEVEGRTEDLPEAIDLSPAKPPPAAPKIRPLPLPKPPNKKKEQL